MWLTALFLPFLVSGVTLSSTETHNNLTLSLSLLHPGFKKDLRIHLLLPFPSCVVTLTQTISSDWFLDLDEIAPLQLNFTSTEPIEVELPKALARTYEVEMEVRTETGEWQGDVPVHLRYNDPLKEEMYREVKFPPPKVVARCGDVVLRGDFSRSLWVLIPVGRLQDRPIVSFGTFLVVVLGALLISNSLLAYSSHKRKPE